MKIITVNIVRKCVEDVCVCVCAYKRTCMHTCVCVCVCVWGGGGGGVGNNTSGNEAVRGRGREYVLQEKSSRTA